MNIALRSAVGLVVYDSAQQRYLILRRNPRRYIGWGLIKGGIDEGETAQQACLREAAEEIGVQFSPTVIQPLGHKCAYYDNTHERIVLVEWFITHLVQQPPLILEREEWVDARWATLHESLYELVWQSQQQVLRVANESIAKKLAGFGQ